MGENRRTMELSSWVLVTSVGEFSPRAEDADYSQPFGAAPEGVPLYVAQAGLDAIK
jgi:hypothetical protein